MFDRKWICLVWRRCRWQAFIALLASIGVIVCLGWRQHRHAVFVAKEADILVHSLAVSESQKCSSPIRVAIFDVDLDNGDATKELKKLMDAQPAFRWKSVSPADIQTGALEGFDVAIFPGGYAPTQSTALGDNGKQAVRQFVQVGGGYVGICAGAFLATAKYHWGMALVNAKPLMGKIDLPEGGTVSIAARGAGAVKMEFTDAGKHVFGDKLGLLETQFGGGPILSPARIDDLSEYVSLALFRTEVWQYEPQRGTMVNTPAIIAGRFGKGRIIIFSPHPEMTDGLKFLVPQAIRATARRR